ncbi:MAG: hypothetical protein IKD87_02945 [Oscillospiraceae bacterium]|nr:hypothetical protein [Oscillospiraceae bacterium]
MRFEYLYPEVGNLYGDSYNFRFLGKCFPEAEIIETHLKQVPAFVSQNVDLIYLGASTEYGQEMIIEHLCPYRERLRELIESGTVFLCTGNALEIFCKRISDETKEIEALGLFDFEAKREMLNRYNSLFLGKMEGFEIVGFKSQFSHLYGDNSEEFMIKAEKGCGINRQTDLEGIRYKHFLGTYVLGPFLLLNPPFVRFLFRILGEPDRIPVFEKEAYEAYQVRLKEYHRPDIKMES